MTPIPNSNRSQTPHTSTRRGGEGFVGDVWIDEMAGAAVTGVSILGVYFAPGAHTVWHQHPRGQALIITSGIGLLQERDGEITTLMPGETISCAPGAWHWHGASPDRAVSLIAVQGADDEGRFLRWDLSTADGYPGPAAGQPGTGSNPSPTFVPN